MNHPRIKANPARIEPLLNAQREKTLPLKASAFYFSGKAKKKAVFLKEKPLFEVAEARSKTGIYLQKINDPSMLQ